MNRSKQERGVTLLEAMLSILVLMMGVGAITQLTRTIVSSVLPAEASVVQHPEIVEQLLHDGAEAVRASTLDPPPLTFGLAPIAISGATYSVRIFRDGLPSIENGFRKVDYLIEVTYQVPDGPEILAGSVQLDKVTGPVSGGGL